MTDEPSDHTTYTALELRFAFRDGIDDAVEFAYETDYQELKAERAALEQRCGELLERCAKLCEQKVRRDAEYGGRWGGYGDFDGDKTGPECAIEIRALVAALSQP